MVVEGLGSTRDNLRLAVAGLEGKSLPPGGKEILGELLDRARAAGVDDLQLGPAPDEIPFSEPLTEAEIGIGVLLGVSSVVIVGLAVLAVVVVVAHPIS